MVIGNTLPELGVIGIRTDSIIFVDEVRGTINCVKGDHGARRIELKKGTRVKLSVNKITTRQLRRGAPEGALSMVHTFS